MRNEEFITAASLLVSENCNLACKYCFEQPRIYKKKMSEEVCKMSIDFLFCQAQLARRKNTESNVDVTFFGGEPMLAFDNIKNIIELGLKYEKKTGIKFNAGIITNGTIIDKEKSEYLKSVRDKVNLNIQLSVDLTEKAHDMFRVTTEGSGTFKRIEKNLTMWKNIFPDKSSDLHVHSCMNKDTIKYMKEGYDYFRDIWEIETLWFMPIHSEEYTENSVLEYEDGTNYILERLVREIIETKNTRLIYSYAPINKFQNSVCHGIPCGAGRNYCTITADGDIYPCHHFYFTDPSKESYVGSVYSGIDEDRVTIYREYDSRDLSCNFECPNCDAFSCYRCIADNYVHYGSIFSCIRGKRCDMSHVEKEAQRKFAKILKEKKILQNKNFKNKKLISKCQKMI